MSLRGATIIMPLSIASLAAAIVVEAALAATPGPPAKICINGVCQDSTASAATVVSGIKWHPGHYTSTGDYGYAWSVAGQRQLQTSVGPEIAKEPLVLGVQQRYTWSALEPSKGVYDFSQIQSDLNFLKSLPTPKRLIIDVFPAFFWGRISQGKNPAAMIPQYIVDAGGAVDTDYGYVAAVWDPAVMDRFIALFQALGAKFDSDPYVEAVIFEGETSISFSQVGLPSKLTIPVFISQYQRWITGSRAAFPTTNVVLMANWLPIGGSEAQMAPLFETARASRVAVGAPDIETKDPNNWGHNYITGANGLPGTPYKTKTAIIHDVEFPVATYQGSIQQIFNFAVDTLGDDHIIWEHVDSTYGTEWSWAGGILPTIKAQNGRINTACPTAFAGQCNRN